MPYLICDECDHYYEIESKEEFQTFNTCECGNALIYVDNLEEYGAETSNDRESIAIGTSYTEKMAHISENSASPSISPNTKTKNKNTQHLILGGVANLIGLFLINIFFIVSILFFIVGIISIIIWLAESSKSKKITPETKTKEKSSWAKGFEGEKIVLNHLNTLPEDYFVFHDVKLPQKSGNIDHVVLGPNGIFVIETKNYNGFFRVHGNEWTYHKYGKFYKTKKSPGKQVINNAMDIKYFLENEGIPTDSLYIKGIVAFVNKNFKIMQKPVSYVVLYPETVPYYIMHQQNKFDENLLKKAALALEPHCIELTFKRK